MDAYGLEDEELHGLRIPPAQRDEVCPEMDSAG